MTRLLNPYEILMADERPVYHPDPKPDFDPSDFLNTVIYPGESASGRLAVVQGFAGVGKTHRLMSDMSLLNSLYGKSDYCLVTSLNNATVDEVNDRVLRERELTGSWGRSHRTLHKIIYHWIGEKVGGQVKVRRKKSPRYLTEPFNDALVDEYVADAEYQNRDKRELSRAFKVWDATRDPLPPYLANPASLPSECGYDWTIYQACLEMQRRYEAGELSLPAPGTKFRGALLIDEAQDLSPLHAVALGWYALAHDLQIRCYGDKNQMMDQARKEPFLWEQGGRVELFFGSDPGRRRVPLSIGKLCEMILPGLIPPAEEWCNTESDQRGLGKVIPVPTAKKGEPIQVCRGFSIHESRYRVRTGFKFVAPGVKAGPTVKSVKKQQDEGRPHVVISTPFMAKGREHELVTIQRWLKKHRDKYLAGDLNARKQLYVAVTRTTDIALIHEDMFNMILEGRYHKWN